MKKIPTLFQREYANNKVVKTVNIVTPGMEWVLNGEGVATVKYDGSCCAIIDGKFYKRYDAKKGKNPPAGAIPCCDPDPVTGHWPHWVLVDERKPEDKWFVEAYAHSAGYVKYEGDGTYEAVGPHFNGNPNGITFDLLAKHGKDIVEVERTYDGIRKWLEEHSDVEGLVFWKDGEPQCKIKRRDFGFEWPVWRNV